MIIIPNLEKDPRPTKEALSVMVSAPCPPVELTEQPTTILRLLIPSLDEFTKATTVQGIAVVRSSLLLNQLSLIQMRVERRRKQRETPQNSVYKKKIN